MSQRSEVRSHNKPMSEEETRRLFRTGYMLSAGAFIFMGIASLLVHFQTIKLYPSSMTVAVVKGYAGRLEFALRYQTLLMAWLMFNVIATIYVRVSNRAFNPLETDKEQYVQSYKNVLTNSIEQIMISVISQLAFVSFAEAECVLNVIPLVNVLQVVGRITFLMGYPYKRSFGFMCTVVPSLMLVVYNLLKFIGFAFNL